jgi:hypothetical protein
VSSTVSLTSSSSSSSQPLSSLGQPIFVRSGPVEVITTVDGKNGYMIRGNPRLRVLPSSKGKDKNKNNNKTRTISRILIETIDETIRTYYSNSNDTNNINSPSSSSSSSSTTTTTTTNSLSQTSQVCYVRDIVSVAQRQQQEDLSYFSKRDPILLMIPKDLSPSQNRRFLQHITSFFGIITILLFSIGIYGNNELIVSEITALVDQQQQLEVGTSDVPIIDYSIIKVLLSNVIRDIMIPILSIQCIPTIGQWLMAKRYNIQQCSIIPNIIPFWPILPYMGTQSKLKESPTDLKALYDYAMIGPILGLLLSGICLYYGLHETIITTGSSVSQYYPSLPIRVLQMSTLGGTIIDQAFDGTIGYMAQLTTSTDRTTMSMPLHPYVIVGYVSLIIQALDLIPYGATNGGRISLTLFGRQGHSLVTGIMWFLLFCCTLLLSGNTNNDILVTSFLVYSIIENDPEIPCRNEIDPIDTQRTILAFLLWFIAILILVPLS